MATPGTNTRIDDGFSTTLKFALNPTVKLWEVEVTLPSIMGRGAINTNNMRRKKVVGKAPKKLKEYGDSSIPCLYAESTWKAMDNMVQKNQLMTFTMPFGGELDIWGWVDEFAPEGNKEGDVCKATIKLIYSCEDNDGNEVLPVYRPAA